MTLRGTVRDSEVIANLRAAPVLTLLLALATFACAFGSVAYAGAETAGISRDWQHQVDAGADTLTVSPLYGTGVPASTCDDANSVSGVIGAGGIFSRTDITPAQSPDSPAGILYVTPGFPSATWASFKLVGKSSVIAPPDFAKRFGLVDGRDFVYKQQAGAPWQVATVDSVMHQRNRVDGVNDALMIVQSAASGTVQTCVVSTKPADLEATQRALQGTFGAGYTVKPFLDSNVTARSLQQLLQARGGIWVGALAGLVILGIQIIVWLGARRDFALYRTIGMTPTDIRLMLCTEVGLKLLVPASAGGLAGFLTVIKDPPAASQIAFTTYGLVLAAITLIPAVGSWLLLRVSAISVIKGL